MQPVPSFQLLPKVKLKQSLQCALLGLNWPDHHRTENKHGRSGRFVATFRSHAAKAAEAAGSHAN